jgi:MFS family permease
VVTDQPRALRLHGWLEPTVLSIAAFAMASGFGQFGAVSALGDVAKSFGHLANGTSVADQAGLSGTKLGLGLAILRLASLGALPLAGFADRLGRRRVLVASCAIGLVLTIAAAASPSYWWFVAIFALGRPLLSTTTAIAQVSAAEETSSTDRAKAVALVAAGYGVGSGLTAVIHGLAGGALGFRGVFALAAVPLLLLPLAMRHLTEPDRFAVAREQAEPPAAVLGAVGREHLGRLLLVLGLAFAVSLVTGPANSFVYIYAQNVLHLSGVAIAGMVVVAAVFGLAGLALGRFLADNLGRRPTGAMAMAAMAGLGVLTYSGSRPALIGGYELGVLAASTFAPAAGAFVNELFPTEVRASVAGWSLAAGVLGAAGGLLAFGAIADVGNRFSVGAEVTFLPVILLVVLWRFLPETKGKEPEELWLSSPG